jgi:hypothetical protein
VLQELSKEIDTPVHINGSNERYQLEEELPCLEWEQEGAVSEYLL